LKENYKFIKKMKKIKNTKKLFVVFKKYLVLGVCVFILFFSFNHIVFGAGPTITADPEPPISSGKTTLIIYSKGNINKDTCQIYKDYTVIKGPFFVTQGYHTFITDPLTESTTYTINCIRSSSFVTYGLHAFDFFEYSAHVDVNVIGMPTTQTQLGFVRINAKHTAVPPGESAEISWNGAQPHGNYTNCNLGYNNGPNTATNLPIKNDDYWTIPLTSIGTNKITVACFKINPNTGNINSLVPVVYGSIDIIVAPLDQIPVVTINANPSSINTGGNSTVSWTSINADSCFSSNGMGGTGISGFFVVSPNYSTFYKVTCTHAGTYGTINIENSVAVYVNRVISVNTTNTISDVKTEDATDITAVSANIWGSMTTTGEAKAYFRYSTVAPDKVTPIFCNEIYGSDMKSTFEKEINGIATNKTISATLNNLTPNTTYYYCLVGSTNGQIAYGGSTIKVKSFTTLMPPGSNPSVTTETALVANETSAYLNGTYNTPASATTWFEYRKFKQNEVISLSNPNTSGLFNSLKKFFNNFIGTSKVIAATLPPTPKFSTWNKVGEKNHNANTSGKINFLLEGLSGGTSYQFRAGIKANSATEVSYGSTLAFTTKGTSSTAINPGGNGIGYEDPCQNPNDPNCNGTGGEGTGSRIDNLMELPDLVAGVTTFSSTLVNTPITLSSVIRNQGKGSTIPTLNTQNQNNVNTGNTVTGFMYDLFGINKAFALAANNNNSNYMPVKGSFYNFFQISIVPQSNGGPTVNGTPLPPVNNGNSTVSVFDNFFKTKKVLAAATTGGATIDTTISNLSPVLMGPLGPKASSTTTQFVTFPSVGTYYVRACADKSSRFDVGLIRESYENNNCGLWSKLVIGLIDTGGSGNDTNRICPAGLTNPPSCNVCLNGAVNPPNCNLINFTECPTGLINPPACDMCLNGASNPPLCTIGSDDNGGGYVWNGGGNNNTTTNPSNLVLGQTATPPVDATVHYREGIETVFQRQIVANTELAESYGYQQGADIQNFAWYLADLLARTFGYVNSSGKEIRVSIPDIAAYQLYMNNGILTVYEYYNSKIVNIQKMTDTLRNKYGYEYYFHK
jgi:hypothetical protein